MPPDARRSLEERIGELEKNEFEDFCRVLLEEEVYGRRFPDASLHGPFSGPDGGKDFRVEIPSAPRIPRTEERPWFVADVPGRQHWFSCKTGAEWHKLVLKDLEERGPGVIANLASGGCLTVLINQPYKAEQTYGIPHGSSKRTARELFADAVAKRMTPPARREDVIERIEVQGVAEIALFFRRHHVIPSSQFRARLGEPLPAGFMDYDAWSESHVADRARGRTEVQFVSDAFRQDWIQRLTDGLNAVPPPPIEGRIHWLCGPPGVGKTRLVLEALAIAHAQRHVLVASSYTAAINALGEEALAHFARVVLVVDDVPRDSIDRIAGLFRRRARSERDSLVLITPEPLTEAAQYGETTEVRPLSPEAFRTLIAQEIAPSADPVDDALVDRIADLAEGFPWYAVLLARACRSNPNAIPEGVDAWRAAKHALAARDEFASDAEWDTHVARRAAALFVAMLTEREAWDDEDLDETAKSDLCDLVGRAPREWRLLVEAAEKCRARGLLRATDDWRYKYVTPKILEREVALHFLRGPANVRHFLRRRVRPRALQQFARRIQSFDLPSDVLMAIGGDILDAVEEEDDPASFGTLREQPALVELLGLAGRWLPGRTARVLRRLVERMPPSEWRSLPSALHVAWQLTSLMRRRDGFADAEAALFRAAVAIGSARGNRFADGWAEILAVELNATYVDFDARLEIARSRFEQGGVSTGWLVVEAIRHGVDEHVTRMGGEPLDGPFVAPTAQDARQHRATLWRWLAELTAHPAPTVSGPARTLAVRQLRDAVRMGVGDIAAMALRDHTRPWDDASLLRLRNAVDETLAYEGRHGWSGYARPALVALREAVAPQSYSERLRTRLSEYQHGERHDVRDEGDRSLAAEGLAPPCPIVAELRWLASPAAKRSFPFVIFLGELDRERRLLDALVALARSGESPPLVAGYLRGLQNREGAVAADAVLESWHEDGALADAIVESIWRCGASSRRVRWLLELVDAGHLAPDRLAGLAWASWDAPLADDEVRPLLERMVASSSLTASQAALDIIDRRVRERRDRAPAIVDLLIRAVDRLSTEPELGAAAAHAWEEACTLLLTLGRVETVLEQLRKHLEQVRFADETHVSTVMRACLEHDADATFSRVIAPIFEHASHAAWTLARMLRSHGFLLQIPTEVVLAWIGSDEAHATRVAEACALPDQLPELARAILIQFGPESPPGRALHGAATSLGVVQSIAEAAARRLARVRAWSSDPSSQVRSWAKAVARDLEGLHQSTSVMEEIERRRRHG